LILAEAETEQKQNFRKAEATTKAEGTREGRTSAKAERQKASQI